MKRTGRKPLRGARRQLGCSLTALTALAAAGVGAQTSAPSVVPSLKVTLTATDNRDLSSTRPQSDLVAEISPGIALASRRGPLQGALNYSLSGVAYARDSSLNTVYHNLAANGRFSLLEGRAGIDGTASAGRQVVSAFDTQSPDANLVRGNQAQVTSYSLSPYVSGLLPGNGSYRGRVTYNDSRSDSAGDAGDTTSLNAQLGFGWQRGKLGFGVDAHRAIYETPRTARAHNGGLVGNLSWRFDVDLQGVLRLGTEVDDIRSGRSERITTWGLGGVWTPTPRTLIRADYDRRFFGRSHALLFSHRTARTIWTLADTRSFQTGGVGGRAIVSAYDLFFAQFASVEPDPARRDAMVRSFLSANGIDPNGQVTIGGFLNTGPTVQRNQTASFAYQGLRTTVMLALLRSQTERLGSTGPGGDFDLTDRIVQHTINLSLSYRLTPGASLVVSASRQRTPGAGSVGGNTLRTIDATWSARLGPSTNASLGLRHTRFDSVSRPYDENALIGSVRMLF
ncbi:MAG TPA: TIGR03016 family PEP-CTERM system-associated outer membrane protein [Rubrivivax sp.]|nr:TIGR03016 family PEP-CTERM system-associated outer membrane protein [Rubrivivax sp.]